MVSGRLLPAALWLAALAVTVLLAFFQRATGPSYPLRGEVRLDNGTDISYRLPRSDQGRGELVVGLPEVPEGAAVDLEWRRYPTDEPFRAVPLEAVPGGGAEAVIPGQPAAGKVEYRLIVRDVGRAIAVPRREAVVARFRGQVPATVLIPHILTMFFGMMVATRAVFEVVRPGGSTGRTLVMVAMVLLGIGGLILGPVVQKYAFGAWWTGWPVGGDLTDTKTLIGILAWLPATILAARGIRSRAAVALGWTVMMGVFLIPHSTRGSELDWSTETVGTSGSLQEAPPAR